MTAWEYTVTNGAGVPTNEYQASVNITGLSAGTQYCYAVFSTDASGAVDLLPSSQPDQTFTTLEAASTSSTKSVTFDVIADTGENYAYTGSTPNADVPFPGGVNPDEASIYHQIGQSGANFLLLAGDIAYNGGTESNYGDLGQTGTDPEVSNIFGPSYFPQTGGIPTFSADGNHGQNVTTLKTWPTPTTATSSGGTYAFDSYSGVDGISGTFPDDWYAFSTGNVRIYVIDGAWADGSSGPSGTGDATGSECTANPSYCEGYQADADEHWQTSSPEYQWLQRDLAAHPGGVKFAVFHYPLRSDNATQPSDPYVNNSTANPNASTSLEALLAANGVDIAFNGHAHTYQRIVPRQSGQIINYVTGGGGGVLEPVLGGTTCQSLLATEDIYALGWSPSSTDPSAGAGSSCGPDATTPQSAAQVYNFLKVTVTGASVIVTPTNAAGQTFDQQTYSFGGSTGSPGPSTPADVTAIATSSSTIQVNWSPSTETGGTIASYKVFRNGSTQIGSVAAPGTGITDTTVHPGTEYTYTVEAVDTAGTVSSPGSSNRVATPTPPASVVAKVTSASSVQLTWSPSTETGGTIAAYQISRNGTMLAMVNSPATAYTDSTAVPGTTYTYTVAAVDNKGGSSSPGTSNSVTTPSQPVTLPFSPPPPQTDCISHLPSGLVVGSAALNDGTGYYEVDTEGDVAAFGAAVCYGALTGIPLNKPIVGMAATPDNGGYWLVASDGGIFAIGDAGFYGSTGSLTLNKPVVGMAATNDGRGYWLVASDGGIFAFGDAHYYGSMGGHPLNKPVVGMAQDPVTGGYWLVASDGGIFSCHAPFYGSTGSLRLNKPVVGIAPVSDGSGYRLVASDGGVFAFDAPFFGSTGGISLNRPMIAGLDDNMSNGYWLVASDGGVFAFNATFYGSAAG
jgi:hypothetical protein